MAILIVFMGDIILTGDDLEEILNLKKITGNNIWDQGSRGSKVFPRNGGGLVKRRDCYIPKKVHFGFVKWKRFAWMHSYWDSNGSNRKIEQKWRN